MKSPRRPHIVIDGIESKQCKKCEQFLPLSDYAPRRSSHDKLQSQCTACKKAQDAAYYQANRDRVILRTAKYYAENRELINSGRRGTTPEKTAKWRSYTAKNRDRINAAKKRRDDLNRDHVRRIFRDWAKKNADHILHYRRERQHKRRQTDVEFRILGNLRTRINRALETDSKAASTKELIGCTIAELKVYLATLFQPGMDWSNHGKGDGKWHIDHIRPCASFDLTDPEQQRQCFHFTNMQPLWEHDNLRKGDRIESQ